jgi:hypothetical protein
VLEPPDDPQELAGMDSPGNNCAEFEGVARCNSLGALGFSVIGKLISSKWRD